MKFDINDENLHRYLRVYSYYRDLIETGKLLPETRLPSIRKCAVQLQLSRTTVETAYMMLAAEGYIISRPQSGYYVSEFTGGRRNGFSTERAETETEKIRFDFAASNVDRDSFQFDLWRRYIKSALRQDGRLLSYGEPQGERELREALCGYLERHRNVVCTPDHIVVGAGVQSLLHILLPMLKERKNAVFYNPDFSQGRTVFQDYGFDTCGMGEISGLPERSLFYLTPSQMTVWGEVMHISERMKLIKEAFDKDILIIEDDYNSEFRYYNRPTPSLQGLSGGRGVVYLGTFSRLLLPSIRMSFMVLPPELLPLYREKARFYNQTASKTEQIALCQFIRDGHLESQIRKTRKLHTAKAKKLCGDIRTIFGDRAVPHLGEAGFLVLAEIRTDLTSEEIVERAKKCGVAVRSAPPETPTAQTEGAGAEVGGAAGAGTEPAGTEPAGEWPRILLSCSTVPVEHYGEALTQLRDAIFSQ